MPRFSSDLVCGILLKKESTMTKILIVSKDTQFNRMLQNTLVSYGFVVETAALKDHVDKHLSEIYFSLILLDFNFYDDQGEEFYNKLSALPALPPVVMMGECFDEMKLLKHMYQTMDDYILKPFGISELKMIINKQLERRKLMQRPIIFGDLRIDVGRSLVYIRDKVISLGKKEFEVLIVLTRKAGKIVVNDKLLTKDRIESVRKKLKAATDQTLDIKSVSGLGYKLVNMG